LFEAALFPPPETIVTFGVEFVTTVMLLGVLLAMIVTLSTLLLVPAPD
jgi:hypothetical protein